MPGAIVQPRVAGSADSSVGHHAAPGRIALLPPRVASQIAAGEVVDRPASVVKELVENALDAGATRILVELEAGGIELIRVVDDGRGIVPDDLALALTPHATSKVRSAEDLDAVATLGFRGEALASIASVARVRLVSRALGHAEASQIQAQDAVVGPVAPASGPPGTTVEVRNLFYNTPARRKFLRSPATEQQRCLETLRELSLAHPHVAFSAACDGRAVLELQASAGPRRRILDVLGREAEPHLIEASSDQDLGGAGPVSVWGLVGLPAAARSSARWQHLLLNGRVVRDRSIQHALREAYRGLVDPSRHPMAVLLIEIDPRGVDVNVHPAKTEVRFRDPGLVHQAVLRTVRDALRRADLTPTLADRLPRPSAWTTTPPGASGGPASSDHSDIWPARDGEADRDSTARLLVSFLQRRPGPLPETSARVAAPAPEAAPEAAPAPTPPSTPSSPISHHSQAGELDADVHSAAGARVEAEADVRSAAASPRAGSLAEGLASPVARQGPHVLQVHDSYVVTQDSQGLVIVDQHALHERVMFEALRARLALGPLESQALLLPAVAEASAAALDLLPKLTPLLHRLGLAVAPLGPGQVAVHAFPTFLLDRGVEPGDYVRDLLARCEAEGLPSSEEPLLREALDMMACKAAVKAGDRLSSDELADLLELREAVERAAACPHGRPTSIRLTLRELEKLFGRT